jgi:hypothetical protein
LSHLKRGLDRLPVASQHDLFLVNRSSFVDGLALMAILPAQPGYGVRHCADGL